jgi:hypothetical protein
MIGFKVLYQMSGGTLTSTAAPPNGEVKYRKGRWTKPRKGCGPLAVFVSFKRAAEYLTNLAGHPGGTRVIWECEYVPYTAPPQPEGVIEKLLWAGRLYTVSVPKGTVRAEKVRLLRKVYP